MARVAVVYGGRVVNVVLADDAGKVVGGVALDDKSPVGPGWVRVADRFEPPPEPKPDRVSELEARVAALEKR